MVKNGMLQLTRLLCAAKGKDVSISEIEYMFTKNEKLSREGSAERNLIYRLSTYIYDISKYNGPVSRDQFHASDQVVRKRKDGRKVTAYYLPTWYEYDPETGYRYKGNDLLAAQEAYAASDEAKVAADATTVEAEQLASDIQTADVEDVAAIVLGINKAEQTDAEQPEVQEFVESVEITEITIPETAYVTEEQTETVDWTETEQTEAVEAEQEAEQTEAVEQTEIPDFPLGESEINIDEEMRVNYEDSPEGFEERRIARERKNERRRQQRAATKN